MGRRIELLIALLDEVLIVVLILFGVFYVLTYFKVVGIVEAICISLLVMGVIVFVAYKIYSAHYRRPEIGPESIVGRVGEVVDSRGDKGMMVLDGELWKFECVEGRVNRGDKVVVLGISGLTVKVKPLERKS